MQKNVNSRGIPKELREEEFKEFVLPHLRTGNRGPQPKLSLHKIFNYILHFLYTGCQWKELPIRTTSTGAPEIHYSRIYKMFRFWVVHGCVDAIFQGTLLKLHEEKLIDNSVVHGDGTTTAAKKGGDTLGFNGHKKVKGEKAIVFCDRNCNILAPLLAAPGNRNESPLLRQALPQLIKITDDIGISLAGSIMSLDGVYDCRENRKAIFAREMIPNINENVRNTKEKKRGRKQIFDTEIFQERFHTIERVFAWEDKFKRLLLRFERIAKVHHAFKTIAYSMINLRHFCHA